MKLAAATSMNDTYAAAVDKFTPLSAADDANKIKILRVDAAELVDSIDRISTFCLSRISENPGAIRLKEIHKMAMSKSAAWSINALLARPHIEDSPRRGIFSNHREVFACFCK